MADLYTGGATVAGTIAYFNSFKEILVADGDSASPVSIELTDSGTIDLTVHLDNRSITLQAFTGDDHITTTVGDDLIFGNDGNDTILAFEGHDTLVGGAGDDSLIGGLGDDVFLITDDLIGQDTFLGGGGTDEVRLDSGNPIALQSLVVGSGAAIETLNLNGVVLSGTEGDDLFDLSGIGGYAGGNAIDLGLGADTFRGTQGADQISGAGGNDSLSGNNGDDWISGGDGDDTLNGGTGNDSFVLGSAAPGLDSFVGGTGDDRVLFDQPLTALPRLILNPTASVEIIEAAEPTLYSGDGNDFWDLSGVTSYAAPLSINLGLGADSLFGALAADQILGGDGNDSLSGNGGDDVLQGGNDNDTLLGGVGDDSLKGDTGNDSLTGGDGADTMVGGAGDDIFTVGTGDRVTETATGGSDSILLQGVTSYHLAAQVEDLVASGPAAVTLWGNDQDNTITSGSGDDRIDGMAGADIMAGGAGDDTYVVDSLADQVIEGSTTGRDTVRTDLATYTLAQRVETLVGTSATGQALSGNVLSNTVIGGAGADTLSGGGGDDLLRGGAGNDLYIISSADDRVSESTTGGTDSVTTSIQTYVLGSNLENLTGTRGSGQSLLGNGLANRIEAGAADDEVNGKTGRDHLTGGAGADSFVFNSALGADNLDRIADFAAEDRIVLENSGPGRFNGLALGSLAATAFKDIGPSGGPIDADDRVLYNAATGALFFDADGAGGLARVQFATLSDAPTLTAADIFVI